MNLENKKQLATIIFAAALGLLTAFLTSQYVQSKISEQTAMLASEYQKKNAGVIQELEMVKKELVRQAKNQAALDQQQQQLRKMQQERQVQVVQAAPQSQAEIEAMQPIEPLSFRTPRGKRAFTIMIDSLSAVGGLVNPGDTVDVIAQLNIPKGFNPKGDKDLVTTMLFQNIEVLAVGTNFDPLKTRDQYALQQRSRSLNLTLAVEPEEAAYLTFAQTNGKLQLALRRARDNQAEVLDVASWGTLADYVLEKQGTEIEVPDKKPVTNIGDAPSSSPQTSVQVFRGGREL